MEGSFAGVDWASENHDVVVQNAPGEELLAAWFAHDEAGLRSLCRQLVRLKVELVAIERPDGVLVERLLDAGLRVLALHPNQVAAARPRFGVSGGKSGWLRRVRAVRAGAHRSSPLPGARARQRPDLGAAERCAAGGRISSRRARR